MTSLNTSVLKKTLLGAALAAGMACAAYAGAYTGDDPAYPAGSSGSAEPGSVTATFGARGFAPVGVGDDSWYPREIATENRQAAIGSASETNPTADAGNAHAGVGLGVGESPSYPGVVVAKRHLLTPESARATQASESFSGA